MWHNKQLWIEFIIGIMPISQKKKKRIKQRIYSSQVRKVAKKCGRIYVNRYSIVNANTILGDNVNFNGMHMVGNGKVVIGNNFHSGTECKILTQNHNYEGNTIPYDNKYIFKDVIIEDNVWFGDRVMVLPGVTIGEGAIIQAGSVVVKDIAKLGIAGGHPAKVFKYRDKEHYYKLKEQKLFH